MSALERIAKERWHAEIKDGDGYLLGGDELEILLVDEAGDVLGQVASVLLDTGTDSPADRAEVKHSEARARAISAVPEMLVALEAVAFELQPVSRELLCRRCDEPRGSHSPDRCEVAAAFAKVEGGAR